MTWRFLMFLIRKIFTTSLITISHHCEVLLFDIQFLKSITPNYSLKLLAFILHFWNVIYQQKIVIKISWAVWELKPRAIFHAGTFWDTELSELPSSLCLQYRVLFDTNHHNLTWYKSNWNLDWGGENKLPLSYPCHALGPQNWNTTIFNVCKPFLKNAPRMCQILDYTQYLLSISLEFFTKCPNNWTFMLNIQCSMFFSKGSTFSAFDIAKNA